MDSIEYDLNLVGIGCVYDNLAILKCSALRRKHLSSVMVIVLPSALAPLPETVAVVLLSVILRLLILYSFRSSHGL